MPIIGSGRSVNKILWPIPAHALVRFGAGALQIKLNAHAKNPVTVTTVRRLSWINARLPSDCPPIPLLERAREVEAQALLELAHRKNAREAAAYLAVLKEHGVCSQTTAPGAGLAQLPACRDEAAAQLWHSRAQQGGSALEDSLRQLRAVMPKPQPGVFCCEGEAMAVDMAKATGEIGSLGIFLLAYYVALGARASKQVLANYLQTPGTLHGYLEDISAEQRQNAAEKLLR